MITRAREEGKFGPVAVVDVNGARRLLINDQVQGGVYLVDGEPSTISEVAYAYGWLVAGVHRPEAEAAMVGLGSGGGVTTLLENFPHMMLTVVEIDPTVVRLVEEHFPDVARFQDTGRLHIVTADARDYFEGPHDFDLCLYDAYDGSNAVNDSALEAAAQRCDVVYVNAIDSDDGPSIQSCAKILEQAGHHVAEIYRCHARNGNRLANYIVATENPDFELIDRFEPFARTPLGGRPVQRAREMYELVSGQALSAM